MSVLTELIALEKIRLNRHIFEVHTLVLRHDGRLWLAQLELGQSNNITGGLTFFAVFFVFFLGLLGWLCK